MQTRYLFRNAPFARFACGLLLVLAFVSLQSPTRAAEDAETEAEARVETEPEAKADARGEDDAEPSTPADSVGGQMGEVSLEKFIPTEEISADGAVSFPVDI